MQQLTTLLMATLVSQHCKPCFAKLAEMKDLITAYQLAKGLVANIYTAYAYSVPNVYDFVIKGNTAACIQAKKGLSMSISSV